MQQVVQPCKQLQLQLQVHKDCAIALAWQLDLGLFRGRDGLSSTVLKGRMDMGSSVPVSASALPDVKPSLLCMPTEHADGDSLAEMRRMTWYG